jgi:segregation and condensation protein A
MTDVFKIKIEGFEGPLELLLSLIEKRKLPINDVSLSQVTDDYIAHIERQGEFPLSQTANFILIASTLLLIKSKSLLPMLELTQEEEESIEQLEHRLKLYKQTKELSVHIAERFGSQILFEPERQQLDEVIFAPSNDSTLPNIIEAIRRVLTSLPKIELAPQAVVKKILSLEEAINNLTDRITKNLRMNFSDLAQLGKEERVTVIVHFLAMLELVKQGILNATQDRAFSDIALESDTISVPTYES